MHYYKFNIADWGLATAHLSLEEEAVYFRLINHYYDTEKPIPLATIPIIRRLRMVDYYETVQVVLSEFFELTDDGWVHVRCEKDLKNYRKTSKRNKLNGAMGGRPSKHVASEVSQEKPSGLRLESQNNPNHKPLTTNQELITKDTGTKRFAPPSQEECINYFVSKSSNDIEACRFFNYYESNGWKVGKNKMKNWKASASGWITRNNQDNAKVSGQLENRF